MTIRTPGTYYMICEMKCCCCSVRFISFSQALTLYMYLINEKAPVQLYSPLVMVLQIIIFR